MGGANPVTMTSLSRTKASPFVRIWNELSITDKLLPLLILIAMIVGVVLSVYVPSSRTALDSTTIVSVSVPIAIGLIVMLAPPLCKTEWENILSISHWRNNPSRLRQLGLSLALNWLICPFLMLALAWLTLFDKDEYRTGIIMIGIARCIAMVIIWNGIAQGDHNLCATIVVMNSVLQLVLYAPMQIFFCDVIGGRPTSTASSATRYRQVSESVAFFMGIPFAFGILFRFLCLKTIGKKNYEKRILPFISPWSLIGLLYTIVVIFMIKGNDFIKDIGDAFRCFVPLIAYFVICFFGTLFLMRYLAVIPEGKGWLSRVLMKTRGKRADNDDPMLCGCEKELLMRQETRQSTDASEPGKPKFRLSAWGCKAQYGASVAQAFTAASNNFELSLAVAISLYGSGSKQAIAATFGPLLEVPVLLILAFVARFMKLHWLWSDVETAEEEETASV